MEIKSVDEIYISATEKALDTKSKKIVLSDEAYAISTLLELLMRKVDNLRFK